MSEKRDGRGWMKGTIQTEAGDVRLKMHWEPARPVRKVARSWILLLELP
jgi:hypothetical protein